MPNPLLADRDVDFQLFEVHRLEELLALPRYRDFSRAELELFLGAVRRFARDQLYPTYQAMDAAPPVFEGGRVRVHPAVGPLYRALVELGLLGATRPASVGGQQLPHTVYAAASAYLMAANLSVYGYLGLTAGAAHLIEAFGAPPLHDLFMRPMYAGRFTGTMALTEPQAGSSLADVKTRAAPAGDGTYRISGAKIFISGGDHDFADNIVHLALARLDGAPAGTRGLSLLAVPRLRPPPGATGDDARGWVDNDVQVTGLVHKIGWRGLPSCLLAFGERGDCHGWLVGEPHRGLAHMFQMMNEARLMVGMNAVATAAVAYHQALEYASVRTQGRRLGERDPASPPVPLVEHADVRRMLLRQKAIVEGALSLLLEVSRQSDLAAHAEEPAARACAQRLVDLLTPVAKTFAAERGFEANALALQVHGGYGYSSEYPVEAWLRDQKLNSIHEGASGIQAQDLLGRKALAEGGAALRLLGEEVQATVAAAGEAGLPAAWGSALGAAVAGIGALTGELAATALAEGPERLLRHASDYLEAFSIACVGWQWLKQAAVAQRALAAHPASDEAAGLWQGKLAAAQHWFGAELPRVAPLLALVRSGEDSFARMRPAWF